MKKSSSFHDPFCELKDCLCNNRIDGLWAYGCGGVSGIHVIGKIDFDFHLAIDKKIAVCGKEVDREFDHTGLRYRLCDLCAKISISEEVIWKFWQKHRNQNE
jgi:hypothetical protein